MTIDNKGFKDLGCSIAFHVGLSYLVPKRPFSLGTIPDITSTMSRCWDTEPTDDRVFEDIIKFPQILSDIVAAGGCTLHEFKDVRNVGKRYIKMSGKGDMKRKPQARDRKATLALRPCHPDLQHVIDALSRNEFPNTAIAQVIDDIDNEINICDEIGDNM